VTFLAVLALALPAAAAPRPTLPPTPPDVSARMNALFARATPAVRTWTGAEARKLRPMPPPDAETLAADARLGFPAAQPPLTPGQADTLAAMAVYQVVSDLDSEARLAPPGPAGDPIAKLSERKSAFLKVLTALLRKTTDADATVVASLR
jgi:hypothetical protein